MPSRNELSPLSAAMFLHTSADARRAALMSINSPRTDRRCDNSIGRESTTYRVMEDTSDLPTNDNPMGAPDGGVQSVAPSEGFAGWPDPVSDANGWPDHDPTSIKSGCWCTSLGFS